MKAKDYLMTFLESIVAGVMIGLDCVVNSRIGGVDGAILFATGLVTIIKFRLPLFTGIVANKPEWSMLFVFLGNVIAAALVGLSMNVEMKPVTVPLSTIFIGSMGTGVLMVAAYKSKSLLIAIMGVTLFIMAGFHHCIAEAGYCRMSMLQWAMSILGNIVGGQVWRLVSTDKLNNINNIK